MSNQSRFLIAAHVLLVPLFGCSRASAGGSQPWNRQVEDVIHWEQQLTMEEREPDVVTIQPAVRLELGGSFLVAEGQERQIRRYLPDGRLLAYFGREGSGPFEFAALSGAERIGNLIYAADARGKIVVFDTAGTGVENWPTGLAPIYDLRAVNDTLLLLMGRIPGDPRSPLLHLWDLRNRRLVRSFFRVPAHPERLAPAYVHSGYPDALVRGDTVLAIFALSDTLYRYHIDGREIGKTPLPLRHFRRVESAPPATRDPKLRQSWSESFSRLSSIFVTADALYVQYFDMENTEPQWRLLRVSPDGKPQFELRDTPRLLAITPESRFIFINPHQSEPNQWVVARMSN